MCKAIEIAKYIVSKCVDDGYPISNLQLQKILFFIQKYYLQKYNSPLFSDSIEAWRFGSVIPEVYYYCGYGAMKITLIEPSEFSPQGSNIIDNIITKKHMLNPWDLVDETHKSGGAWDKIYNNGKGEKTIIPNDMIRTMG